MKLFICFVVFVLAVSAQALTDEQKANWKKWSEECKTETGVSQEAIDKIRNNQFDAVDDPKIKQHALCFSKKAGLVDEDGNILVDQFRNKLNKITSEEEAEKIVTKCVVKKDTPEETAFDTFKCVRENRPKFNPV